MCRNVLLALTLLLAGPVLAAPTQVHLGWQGPTSSTITVIWRSSDASGAVEYGLRGADRQLAPASSLELGTSWLHEAELTGLAPGATYEYRCGAGTEWTPDRTLTTGPLPSARATFRFAVVGDSRYDDAARRRVRAAMQAANPAFSIHTGDLVESGLVQADWDEWFDSMEPLLAGSPIVPVAGNHEGGSALFFQQFALPRRADADRPEAYFSFDYGNTHFVGLSTEPAGLEGSPQRAWLEADLAGAAANPDVRWIVAYFHRPPYSSGVHGSDLDIRASWGPLLERYGVDLVFAGHDHDYERTLPISGGAVASAGTVYVVSGGGGAPLGPVGVSEFTAFARSVHHFTDVEVGPDALTLRARDVDGNAFDVLTLQHPAPLGGGDAEPPAPVARADAAGRGCSTPGHGEAVGSLVAVVLVAASRRRRRGPPRPAR